MWVNIHTIDELQEGDVIEFVSKVPDTRWILPGQEVPLVLHYGIILIENGIKKIGHNTFQNYPKIDDIEKTLNGREIKRVFRSGIQSKEILNIHNQLTNRKYNSLFFNCEDYIRQIVQPNGIREKITGINGIDQRAIWILVGLFFVIIIILLFNKK